MWYHMFWKNSYISELTKATFYLTDDASNTQFDGVISGGKVNWGAPSYPIVDGNKISQAKNGNITHYAWSSNYMGTKCYFNVNPSQGPQVRYNDYTSFGNNEIVYNKQIDAGWRTGFYWYWASMVAVSYLNETRISTGARDSINPSVACNGSNVYIAWEDWRNNKGEIYMRQSTNEGDSWLPETCLVASAENCCSPSIAINGNNMFIAFAKQHSGHRELNVVKSTDGGSSWSDPVRLTMYEVSSCETITPSIVCDNTGNAYVAWEDSRSGTSEIYYQMIPSNFAPFDNAHPRITTMSIPTNIPGQAVILSGSSTLELISPINGAAVDTLRPTFKWYGMTGISDYKIECSTSSDESSLNGSGDYYNATINDVSGLKPECSFTQDERFMGLDESSANYPLWYWRVQAIGTSEVATSEVGCFTIQLPNSLCDVTNWPNPFDPNKEMTKIRYRLGREADNVTIRIYDITGKLVRELDGTCYAEQGDVWHKYNDVEWDGRNGRGDVVLNGVYPFEVTADYGDKSQKARGKAVVLK